MFIDTHAHLNMPDYDSDREEVIAYAFNEEVEAIIDVAFDLASAKRSLALFGERKNIYSTVGIHPHDSEKLQNEVSTVKELSRHKNVKAIGEIGLDYHYMKSSKDIQKDMFIKQIEISLELNLPVIIHIREAYDDAKQVMDGYKGSNLRAVFHCFSGDRNFLDYVLGQGWFVSFDGPITFPKAQESRELLKSVPMDRFFLETDCPYLTPVPFRGKRNQPGYVKYVAIKAAEVKSLSFEEVGTQTTKNAKAFFKI